MANFSLEDARKASYCLEDGSKCLQDARKASYSLEAAMPQCKGEENNPTQSYSARSATTPPLLHSTQREATGEEIVLIILCQNLATAKRALHIIQRDLGSQLLQVEQCDTVVGAYLSTLQGFNPSECLSFYHYHLHRSLGHQAQVWITTKGGQR